MIKIKSIEFFNDEVFGNRKFDFTFDDGSIATNIVFAGENGSGKTKLLDKINALKNRGFAIVSSIETNNRIFEVCLDVDGEGYYEISNERGPIKEVVLSAIRDVARGDHYACTFKINGRSVDSVGKEGVEGRMHTFVLNSIYSKVDINYTPRNEVAGATNKVLDDYGGIDTFDLAHETIQLLVDIDAQDASELKEWCSLHRGQAPLEELINKRMNRFINAFNAFFLNHLSFKGIRNNTIPIFTKENIDIRIQDLSSGEKQIVFRGVQLLRNKNSLKGIPALIDEPEISMHPKWEKGIYEYYKNIFMEGEQQTSQIFFATHSEHVLENALDDDKCLILKFDGNSCKKFYKGSGGIILPTITQAEIKYSIFNMYTTDFHIALYGYLENLTEDQNGNIIQEPSIKNIDSWLSRQGVTPRHSDFTNPRTGYFQEYETLQTLIRNHIDHPNNGYDYSLEDLKKSIEEMIDVIKANRNIQQP